MSLQGRYSQVQDRSLDAHERRYEESFEYHSQYHYEVASSRALPHDYEKKTIPGNATRQYKPTALRWPFLLTLLLALLTTLAFLIYAFLSLPAIGSKDASGDVRARGLSAISPSHISIIEVKAQRTDAAIHESLSPTSTSSHYTPTEWRSTGARSRPESVIFVSVLTTIFSSDDSQMRERAEAKLSTDFGGDIEMRNIRALDTSTNSQVEVSESSSGGTGTSLFITTTSDANSDIGSETGTGTLLYTSTTPTPAESKPESDFGQIGTKTVTEVLPDTTTSTTATATTYFSKPESDFGKIGTQTVTEDIPHTTTSPTFAESKPESDFGKIGTKTVTEALPDTTTSVTTTENIDSSTSTSESINIGTITSNNLPTSSITPIETVTYITLGATTITGTDGSPITTSTRTPSVISSLQTNTLTDSEGQATATQVATVTVTPSTSVETDSAGNPTATVALYPIAPLTVHTAVYVINAGHYFVGTFLPTLVASILAIGVQILDTNVKSFQPWHALTHEQGALGIDSLCLDTGGWRSLAMGLRSLAGGHAVVFLASLLSLASAVLIPVSAGSVTLDLRGDGCKLGGSSASNCAYVLSVSPTVAKAAIGILAVMSLATILLVIVVGRWRLGVYTNPWSMSTLASLSANPEVQRLMLDAAEGADKLKHLDFKLDYYRGTKGHMEYGIVALDRFNGTGLSSSESTPLTSRHENGEGPRRKHSSPFFMLGIIGRLCSLFVLGGVLVLVLYYALTGGDTAFERFIDSDSFGVQFLFSSLGVIISLLWSSFFSAVAIMVPYQALSERPREASQSILLAPPTNAFSGLWYAARTRRLFLGVVSLASIFSQSLSIFLSNVPFQVTQTLLVYKISVWTSVGIMSSMFLILLVSFFIKWPDMPVGPGTIAGAMYYLCGTTEMFEGLGTLSKEKRDRTITDMGLLYEFGETVSAVGDSRIGLIILQTKSPYPGW
ncbi:hypothetical protein GGR51DRAFT_358806 [Nemania sp. FL0031]|nr:hypothetical protein GGR51DRAFT_358806 [Nemania sp. FL0031]